MSETLTLCLIVKNEAQLIGDCLAALRPCADDCVVVDTGSTDDTVAIARRFDAEIVHYPWNGNYGLARNVYLEHARGTWVMVIDADETIAAMERPCLRELMSAGADAYRFTVHNYTRSLDLLGRWHPNTGRYPDEEQRSRCPGYSRFDVVRLFRRHPAVRYDTGTSAHVNPLATMGAAGFAIQDAGVVIHHFQYLKGGDRFIAAKQQQRLAAEIAHADADRQHFLSHLNAGRSLFSLGDDERAAHYLSRAVEIDSASALAWFARGVLRCETGLERLAVRDLIKALRLDASFADAWVVLGMTLHRLGHLNTAARALTTALQLQPAHPLASNSLGVVQVDRGDEAAAARLFRQAMDVLPGLPVAALNLADLYTAADRQDEAAAVLAEASTLHPDDPQLAEARRRLSATVS